jgi:hypothetical protein
MSEQVGEGQRLRRLHEVDDSDDDEHDADDDSGGNEQSV